MSLELPPATDLCTLLALDAVSPDAFLAPSGFTGWGRIYGGQAVAQALRAASLTVDPGQLPQSLHAYYLREGAEPAPVLYEVERLRDGQSFSTRQVVASQAGGAIFTLLASFHRPEESEERPGARRSCRRTGPGRAGRRRDALYFQTRAVRDDHGAATLGLMRAIEDLGNDPVIHACALAYLSDEHLLGAALSGHSLAGDWEQMMTASLDHAIWFHRPVRADDWLCFVLDGQTMADAQRSLGGADASTATACRWPPRHRRPSVAPAGDARGRADRSVGQSCRRQLGHERRVTVAPTPWPPRGR